MKKMFKKTIATAVVFCMIFSIVCSLGLVGMTAMAAADYYEFVELPGFTVWTDEELALQDSVTQGYCYPPVHSTESLPAGVDDAIKYTIKALTTDWHSAKIATTYTRNFNTATDPIGIEWGARSRINGKDLVGDVDLSDCDGICFWIGTEGGRFAGKIKIQLSMAEAKGPFYKGTDDGANDLGDTPIGFLYESDTIYSDDDGYFYFDFDENFRQVDWWSVDDDGISQSIYDIGEVNTPLPEKVRNAWGCMQIISGDVSVGTSLYVADLKGYKDTRVFTDFLEEATYRFESVNVDAYTSYSYNAASEVYMAALDMLFGDIENYTQKQVDYMAARLNNAIDNLVPLYPVKSGVEIAGFGVWDESDLEIISDGGISRDIAFLDDTVILGSDEYSIGIITTATMGPPDYGWSKFVSLIEGDDGEEAVKNPFGADLSETEGLKFLVSYSDGFEPVGMQIGVGVAGESYFVANEPGVVYPTAPDTQGIVYVPWVEFYDYNGEADIYDYLDRLDYIEISLPEASQIQINISDLDTFVWGVNEADTSMLADIIEEAENDIASKDEAAYYPDTWATFIAAFDAVKDLEESYGITDADVTAAVEALEAAEQALLPIAEGVEYELLKELYNNYLSAQKIWKGNYTLSSGNKVGNAVNKYEDVMGTAITAEKATELNDAFVTAFNGLKEITYKTLKDDIVSFEDYSEFDLDYCMANRSEGVYYSIGASDAFGVNGLKMRAIKDLKAGENAGMSFYSFLNSYYTRPLLKDALVGDLSGSNGFMFDVQVNDLTLASDVTLAFGVLNATSDSPFNKCATDIKLPASGSGKIYIPTYMLTKNVGYTGSIDYSNIAGYYFEVYGDIEAGLEITITNIEGYTGNTNAKPEAAVISNVTEGETYEAGLIPVWNSGVALLDGEAYDFGAPIIYNGEHILTVITGENRTNVSFNIVGGIDAEDYIPGDFDLDGEITVADALAALRIAAKMTECTSSDLKIGDMDKDGEISVADALAILRIAAQMA